MSMTILYQAVHKWCHHFRGVHRPTHHPPLWKNQSSIVTIIILFINIIILSIIIITSKGILPLWGLTILYPQIGPFSARISGVTSTLPPCSPTCSLPATGRSAPTPPTPPRVPPPQVVGWYWPPLIYKWSLVDLLISPHPYCAPHLLYCVLSTLMPPIYMKHNTWGHDMFPKKINSICYFYFYVVPLHFYIPKSPMDPRDRQ